MGKQSKGQTLDVTMIDAFFFLSLCVSGQKELKPVSFRVREAAEGLLTVIMEHLVCNFWLILIQGSFFFFSLILDCCSQPHPLYIYSNILGRVGWLVQNKSCTVLPPLPFIWRKREGHLLRWTWTRVSLIPKVEWRETVINIEIKSYIVNYKCGDKDQKVTKGKHRILVKDMISSNFFKKTYKLCNTLMKKGSAFQNSG